MIAIVDVGSQLDQLLPQEAPPPRNSESNSPSARAKSVSGFWPAIIGLSSRMQALQVEDQVVGGLVAMLAILGHHRLDDHSQTAGEVWDSSGRAGRSRLSGRRVSA